MPVVNYLKKVQLPNNTEYTVKDPTFFTGTTEEWNLLSIEEKQSYQIVNLTDDEEEGDISGKADKVTNAVDGNFAGLDSNGNLTDSGWNGAKDTTSISGNPISISGLKSNQLAVNPIITLEPIQAGSGTPSPVNQRPISGYDKVEALSCGAKVWNGLISNGHLDANGQYVADTSHGLSDYVLVASGSYIIKTTTFTTFSAFYMSNYDGNKNYISQFVAQSHTSGNSVNYSFTIPEGTRYIRLQFNGTGQISANTDSKIYVGLSTATQDNDYVKATSISESLGQTVYGGNLDVRTGEFTVTKMLVDLGSLAWYRYSTTSIFHATPTGQKVISSVVCDSYNGVNSKIVNLQDKEISASAEGFSMGCKIGIRDDSYTDATAFGNSLTGKYAVTELETPFTIQLTPHEISLLKDYDYVSTNGTNIALAYHNGEMASLSDISKLGETVNEGFDCLKDYVKANYRGGNIDISGYSGSNKYKIPNDGYINVDSTTNTSGYARVVVQDSDGNNLAFCYMNVTAAYQIQSVFVRKGMLAYVQANTANAGVTYVPLA